MTDQASWERAYQHTRRNRHARQQQISAFQLARNARILDYGCGDGLDLHTFRELGYESVVGLDNSERLLRQCQGEHVLVVGDCEQTPFADDFFDIVYVNSVLHHLNFDRAIVEIRRILRPGGLLCLIEPRSGWPRRLLDFVTLSPLATLIPIPQIRHRRTALLIERAEYTAWLRRDGRLIADLRSQGFETVLHRQTLFSIILACRRR